MGEREEKWRRSCAAALHRDGGNEVDRLEDQGLGWRDGGWGRRRARGVVWQATAGSLDNGNKNDLERNAL